MALKLVKPGMDSRQVLARFEAERQALAMMDHPNIARVLDAGTTPQGRPYFAMELVKGVPITKFCDERKLSPRERLELFVPVCQAVQHAHQKGVIHRDLKPSNVLIALYDDKPVPKVIDFGIAKAVGTKLTDQSVFTEFGAIIGTLEYMSPEQAQLNQLDIDTRSDVYSLGVLLYELLTGTTPMNRKALGQAALLEILQLVREAQTPRPSHRLSTVAGLPSIALDRGLDPKKLSGLVRGDLDWIAMKALEKDRSRRYETANALARDVQRHLNGEAVEACPPSASYRLRKFARRHRVGLSAGTIVATALVAASAVSTWQAIRATRAERSAVESAEIERLTNRFFIDDLLGNASLSSQVIAGIKPDPDIKVRTLVDRAADGIGGRFDDQPLLEAAIRKMIGRVYESLGLHDRAMEHLERAYELRRRLLGEASRLTLGTAIELGQEESRLALHDRAVARLRRSLDLAIRHHGDDRDLIATTHGILGFCLEAAGRHDEAEVMTRRELELISRNPGVVHHSHWLILQNNLAIILTNLGDEAGAEALLEGSLRQALAEVGEDHPMVPLIRINLALIQRSRGQYLRAEATARKALEACRRLFGDDHQATLASLENVGLAQLELGQLDEAEATIRTKFDLARRAYGAGSEQALYATTALVEVLNRRGRVQEAEALLLAAQESARKLDPRAQAIVEGNLGLIDEAMGRYPEAERRLRKAEAEYERLPSPEKRFLLALKRALARSIADQGRHREAIDRYRDVLKQCEAAFGPDDILTFHTLAGLVNEYRVVGLDAEAEALYPRVIALARSLQGPEAYNTLAVRQGYAALLHVRGKFEAAEAQYQEDLDAFTRLLGPEHGTTLQVLSNLGELYRDWGRPEQAEPLLKRALEAGERVRPPEHPQTLWTLWKIAEMDRDRGRLDEAEAMFRRCIEGYAKAQGEDGLELAMLRADLAMNHLKKHEPARAEPLLRQALATYETQLPDDWRRFEIQGQLGEALAAQGNYDEAEPLILGGHEGLTSRREHVTVDARPRLPESTRRVVQLYEAWGKPELATRWKSE